MAQNRQPESEARDGSSSEEEGSSEENEEQEGLESESESEEDKTSTPPPKKPSVAKKPETPLISAHPQASSSDDAGSDSDAESDSVPNNTRRADPNIKPNASKPVEEPPKATKKPRSKPSLVTSAAKSGTTTTAAKRQAEAENNSNQESKRAKRKAVDTDKGVEEETLKKTGDGTKKQLFQRLWSEEDEIAILKGMIDYTAKKGADPVADMIAFHGFIKKSLHVDVSKTQLSEKVRRLKKKYENNASKGKEGEDRTFTKPHEQKAYELSKKVWGGESNSVVVDNTKSNGKARKNQKGSVVLPKVDGLGSPEGAKEGSKMEVEPSSGVSRSLRFNRNIGESAVEDEIIKDGLELITGPKKLELEEKWKKLRVEEVELYLKRVDLIREQTKVVLEVLKSPGN